MNADMSMFSLLPGSVDNITYLIDVVGGMTIFSGAWWVLCFAVRNGIDGGKAVSRAIRERKPLMLGKILTGGWKPLHDMEPVVPAHSPTIEETWKAL